MRITQRMVARPRGILILVEFRGREHTICKEMEARSATNGRNGHETSSLKSYGRVLSVYSNDDGRFN